MKRIIICLVCILLVQQKGVSQTIEYDTCQYIHQYAGEWMYANGSDTIRIFLRATRHFYSDYNLVEDILYGWHEYKQGNTIIESVYQNRFMDLSAPVLDTITNNSFSIGLNIRNGMDCTPPMSNKVFGSITDYLQAKEVKIVTATLNAAGNQLTWEQRHSTGYGNFTGAYGMTLPREFVLIRQ